MSDELIAIDLFCGAGGFSEGLQQACERLGFDLRHAAINHWQPAIETHERNHPDAVQYHSKVEQLHPPDVVDDLVEEDVTDVYTADAEVDLLVAGPECTHFSSARGGKPVSEQKRMSPWQVLDWLEKLDVKNVIIENVGEIQSWGAVEDGTPTRDGSVFDAWVNAMNQLGYSVDWTTLNAANFGDPTSRKRFFLIARQTGTPTFPDPTHSAEADDLPDPRPAAEIIDWSDLGDSIWTRDLTNNRIHTPPKDTTMQRIAEGIRRHCHPALEQFAATLEQLGRDEIRTLRQERVVAPEQAAEAARLADGPFLVRSSGARTAHHPYVLKQQDGGAPNGLDTPTPTIPSSGAHAIATPITSLIKPKNGPRRGIHSNPLYRPWDRPHHTVIADPRSKLVSPSLVRWSHGGATLPLDQPMPTIATERGGVFSLSSPYLCPMYNPRPGQAPRTRSVDRPLMTVPASKPAPAWLASPTVRPFIDDYEGPPKPITDSLGTITSRDRFALCVPELWPWGIDINYRMLTPDELKQAQGFPEDYQITGSKSDQTEQIGNAVPVNLARSLIEHVLTADDPSLGAFGGGVSQEGDVEIPDYSEVISDD